MMDQAATRAVEQFVHADYPLDAAAVLLVEADGTPEEVGGGDGGNQRVLMREAGATEIRVSRTRRSVCCYWSGRKAAFPAVGRISPDYYCIDGTIPRTRAAARAAQIAAWSQRVRLAVRQRVSRGRRQPASADPVRRQQARRDGTDRWRSATAILELCIEVGGTITGEHGVGVEKLDAMCVQFAPAELERFLGIKAAFDAHRPARTRARRADARIAARNSARCTCTTASCRIRSLPRF